MLRARVHPASPSALAGIDLARAPHCVWEHGGCNHVRLDLPDGVMRLDLVEGTVFPGLVMIEPAIELGRPLDPQLMSIQRLDALVRGNVPRPREQRLVRLVEALRAADALAAGASLCDIGLGVLGDDWPGDGEHLKSRARRRVALAAALMRAGPRGVLAQRI